MAISGVLASATVAAASAARTEPPPGAPPSEHSTVTFPRPKDPDDGLRAAVARARKQKGPVEVLSSATEISKSWAFPDGHITTDTYAAPAQVKKADGSWSWIDNSLAERDGALRPRVSGATVAVELSSGGHDRPFASIRVAEKGQKLALIWPKTLPRPTVDGNVATYEDAAGTPGADLVVTALTTGFRFDVVLRERPKGPVTFRLPVRAEGLSLGTAANGALTLTDAAGKKVTAGSPPVMWDGSGQGARGARGAQGAQRAQGARRAPVGASVEGGRGRQTLVLTPDARFLADPATRFPVTVDPTVTIGVRADTWIENSAVYGGSQYSDSQLWAGGYVDPFSGPYLIDRSFLTFDTSALAGRAVQSASLSLTQNFATGCGDGLSGLKVQRITEAWDEWTLNWRTQPATTTAGEAVARDSAAWGTRQTMTWPVTGIVQAWAGGTANHGVVLRGVDETASRPDYNRIFGSAEVGGPGIPKLTVSYALPPEIPTVSADLADSLHDTDAVVRSSTVGLTYLSGNTDGSPIDYSMTINETTGDLTAPGPSTGPAGQAVRQSVSLGNPHSFTFTIKACLNGVTPATCSNTPVYRITTDAPFSPAALGADLSEPANPVLSGVLSRPSDTPVTGRFYLYDNAGTPIGPSPAGEGAVAGGGRVSLRLPDGQVQPGMTYKWQLQACVLEVCTEKSALSSFTVPAAPPPPPTGTTQIVVNRASIAVKAARTARDACAGGPCTLTDSPAVQAGGAGGEQRLSVLAPDLGAIPAGARITRAVLNLGTASCEAGTCPPGAIAAAFVPNAKIAPGATGTDVAAALNPESSTPATADQPRIDITDLVSGWIRQPAVNHGVVVRGIGAHPPVVSFGAADAAVPTSLVIDYLPPTAPGAVEAMKVRQGDQGALVTWAPPHDPGSTAEITGYEIQALDPGNQVVKQATVTGGEGESVVTGLTNGVGYRFQVRAGTVYGIGPWTLGGTVVPQAVPGGSQRYLDAVRQFALTKSELTEGKSATIEQALSTKPQAGLVRAIAHTQGRQPAIWAAQAAARHLGQQSSTTTLSDSLVSMDTSTGVVSVHTTMTGGTVFADRSGTAPADVVNDSTGERSDFVFRPNGNQPQLAQAVNASAADPDSAAGELNAWPAGTPPMTPPADASPLAVDAAGFPDYSAGAPSGGDPPPARGTAANAGINQRGIKLYAVAHAHDDNHHHLFDSDCTNFASQAINRGGGAPLDPHPFPNPFTRGNDDYWWQYSYTHRYLTSSSWSAANNWYRYWIVNKKRASWLPSWKALQQGDILIWNTGDPKHGWGHLSIVSNIGPKGQVFYAQHSGDHSYKALATGYPDWLSRWPKGKVYGIRINR